MRVGIVTPRYPPNNGGGGEVSAQLLAQILSDTDEIDEVVVYTFDGDGPTRQDGARIRRHKSPLIVSFEVVNLYSYFKLREKLTEDEIDLIHSYNMQLHPVVGHLSNKLDIPSVATLNSYAFIPYRDIDIPVSSVLEWYKIISKATTGHILRNRMRQIDTFVAISSTIAEIYRREMFGDQNIEVIPNMCEPHLFDVDTSDMKSIIDIAPTQNTILYVGSLRETKGVKYLIRAANYLPENNQIVIAGGGKNKESLRELSDKIGVADQVTLLGRVPHDDIQRLYARADLFVHPGIWPEPFGRTILEAMQFGLPVVATNIGGPAEVIPQEEYLCEPENSRDLAETIQDVFSCKSQIGVKNKEYVYETYSPDVVVPQLLTTYNSANNAY
ncbi:glycosyltransferase family 4 protein [Halalkalicoccus subterraneus]|uniref:glycosyltransferase family 4 protein n=1 Tax=Halalkalicoccus subterraneus TaxID=2675002 RepID=UPI000EFA3DF4|nr:glycosyltransferase family 4 protein [Halalkalicoccus subterraneus]